MGIKRPLSISLPTQSRQIVSNAKLDLCIFNHQFSALKNTGISNRHSSFSTRKKKHISFIYKPKLAGKFSPTHSLPHLPTILKCSWKIVERIPRPGSSSSLNSATYKLLGKFQFSSLSPTSCQIQCWIADKIRSAQIWVDDICQVDQWTATTCWTPELLSPYSHNLTLSH